MNVITKWGKCYYKVGQLFLLQSEANCVTKWGSSFIIKVGQILLQSGAGITKWGIITKWCITEARPDNGPRL